MKIKIKLVEMLFIITHIIVCAYAMNWFVCLSDQHTPLYSIEDGFHKMNIDNHSKHIICELLIENYKPIHFIVYLSELFIYNLFNTCACTCTSTIEVYINGILNSWSSKLWRFFLIYHVDVWHYYNRRIPKRIRRQMHSNCR